MKTAEKRDPASAQHPDRAARLMADQPQLEAPCLYNVDELVAEFLGPMEKAGLSL